MIGPRSGYAGRDLDWVLPVVGGFEQDFGDLFAAESLVSLWFAEVEGNFPLFNVSDRTDISITGNLRR
jgi:hypothetical protein